MCEEEKDPEYQKTDFGSALGLIQVMQWGTSIDSKVVAAVQQRNIQQGLSQQFGSSRVEAAVERAVETHDLEVQ